MAIDPLFAQPLGRRALQQSARSLSQITARRRNSLSCGATTAAFFALGPNFAQRRGLDAGGIAAVMASGTLGGALMAWPLGWVSDRMDRRIVIIGAALTASAALLVLTALIPSGAPLPLLCFCVALLGATIVPTYSVVMAHVNDFRCERPVRCCLKLFASDPGDRCCRRSFACWYGHGRMGAWTGLHTHRRAVLIVGWGFCCLGGLGQPSTKEISSLSHRFRSAHNSRPRT